MNVAEVAVVDDPSAGPEVIEVSGGVVSVGVVTVQVRVAGVGSVFPAGSRPRRRERVPAGRQAGQGGAVGRAGGRVPPSRAHRNVELASVEV